MNANFNLSGVTMLSKSEMKNVKGGIPAAEYCAIMEELWEHNADSWSAETIEGWWHGYSTHCK